MERREDGITLLLDPGKARKPFTTRPANAADNAQLIELAAACPMKAAVSICVHREPDFFALNRLESDRWSVAVAEADGGLVIGCSAMAARRVWLDGRIVETTYVSDLKVHPDHRGKGAADALTLYAWDWCSRIAADVPALITVLGGNTSMERRIRACRAMPPLTRSGTIRVHTVSLLGRRRVSSDTGTTVSPATPEDLEEMADLWRRVMSGRQFAPAHSPAELAEWIAAAPGLEMEDYWLARDRDGRIAGYLALWDQRPLKQLHVVGLTLRGAIFRTLFNAAAHALAAPRIPPPGDHIPCLAALHVCVPADRPEVLHRLLATAHSEFRGRYSFFTVGLDVRDPLTAALRGFWRLPADVYAFVTSPDGRYAGPRQRAWPFHFETALV